MFQLDISESMFKLHYTNTHRKEQNRRHKKTAVEQHQLSVLVVMDKAFVYCTVPLPLPFLAVQSYPQLSSSTT